MRKRQNQEERAAEGDEGKREARCDQRRGRRRDENAERRTSAPKTVLSVVSD